MPEENSAIAIIPGECFRWRAHVQFIESFRTRAVALNYAFQNGYNLIVERTEGAAALYDVLLDPDGVCTSGLDLELLKTEEVLVDPGPTSWTRLLLWTTWDLAKRFATLASTLYVRQIVPLSRRTGTVTAVCLRKTVPISRRAAAVTAVCLRKTVPISRRAAAVTAVYLRKTVPISRRVAAVTAVYLRKTVPISRRVAAVAGMYLRETGPRLRHAAIRLWWSDSALAFRRGWHRHAYGTVGDRVKRFAATGSLHLREATHSISKAAGRYHWADVEAACRHAWTTSRSTGYDLGRRFATVASKCSRETGPVYQHTAAVARVCLRKTAPLSRLMLALASSYLREIVSACRRAVAFANLYIREITPILRSAAAKSWSDSKNGSRRERWAVVTANHSSPSRLR